MGVVEKLTRHPETLPWLTQAVIILPASFLSNPIVRGDLAPTWMPQILKHTTLDALWGFGCAALFAAHHRSNSKSVVESLVRGARDSFLALGLFELGQKIIQSLGLTDKGFAWEDFPAYGLGAATLLGAQLALHALNSLPKSSPGRSDNISPV